jgi:hypothetical protein
MNTTKSWVCYFWLLTIESLEELRDFASTRNPVSRRGVQLRSDDQSGKHHVRFPVVLRKQAGQSTGIHG